jgi:membrane fusion protein, multidrug efflux system
MSEIEQKNIEGSTIQAVRWLSVLPFKIAPWLACMVALLAVLYGTTNWTDWTSSRPVQSTNNAFIKSEPAILSARVGGYVERVFITDYQQVKAGDVLVELDMRDCLAKVKAAEAARAKAQAVLDNLASEEAQQEAAIRQANATVLITEAKLQQAEKDYNRSKRLVAMGTLADKSLDDANAALTSSRASREAATAAVELAKRQLQTISGLRPQRQADRDVADAAVQTAQLELQKTKIIAPFDGVLGRRSVQLGSLVATGTQIVTIIPLNHHYVLANYKETQLRNIRVGQPVQVHVDALPDAVFTGRVEQIAPMSGNESSAVPTENATGNFTKIVQRIPVRISLQPGQPELALLRSGMSAESYVDTKGEVVPVYVDIGQNMALEVTNHARN